MRAATSTLAALASALAAFPVAAQETLDDLEKTPAALAPAVPAYGLNGYVDDRASYAGVDRGGLAPTADMPALQDILEANVQLRVFLGSKKYFVAADVSLFAQSGFLYQTDGSTTVTPGANHDIASLQPFFVPSELYVSASPAPWLNVVVGKKRVTWGSGFAFNPTDLISPPKDPTDPNFQRAGNWVAKVELPFERFTLTGLFAPQVLATAAGVPYVMLRYPSYQPSGALEPRDDSSHYLLAARLYALLFDADVNLIYYFSNRYQDGFEAKSRVGLSFSRYFFTDYELHAEGLGQFGSSRSFACTAGCAASPTFAQTRLGSTAFYPRILVGTRRQFSDESMVSLEYYFQGDGYSPSEFAGALQLLSTNITGVSPDGQASALPQRFALDPLRQHYLIASYSKPHLFDDWTLGAVLVAGLSDLSGVFTPSVAWSATEWLTVSLYGFFPIRGLGVGEVTVGGRKLSEYALTPYDYRVLLEVRAFY